MKSESGWARNHFRDLLEIHKNSSSPHPPTQPPFLQPFPFVDRYVAWWVLLIIRRTICFCQRDERGVAWGKWGLKEYKWKEFFLVGSFGSSCLGRSSLPSKKFSLPYTISVNLSPSHRKLGRQSCWVACLWFLHPYLTMGEKDKRLEP